MTDAIPTGPAIEVQGVSKAYGRSIALNDLNLSVPWGRALTIFGPNGSGKTTLIKILATLSKPDAGTISIAGLDARRDGALARRLIGVMTHDPLLYDDLTARENLRFTARMFGLEDPSERIETLSTQLDIKSRLDQRVGTLSHGWKKRFSLARALLHDPPILLMDEPESGLDEQALTGLGEVLGEESVLRRTVVLTTHNFERGLDFGDEVAIPGERPPSLPRDLRQRVRRRHAENHIRAIHQMTSYLAPILAIVWKDIVLETRTKDIITAVLAFSLLVIVVFNFAIDPTPRTVGLVAPGILWIAFVFGGVLGLNRSFALEKDNGNIHALMLAPVSREVIFFGKTLSNLIFMLVVELVTLPVFAMLFNYSLQVVELLPVMLLATLGIVTVGSVFSSMAVNTRAREVMLPLLFLPVALPAVIAAVEISGGILEGGGIFTDIEWLAVLAAFDAIFLVVCPIAFHTIVED